MSESFFVDVRWRNREETTSACAERLALMLDGVAAAHPALARWNRLGYTLASANKPAWAMPPNVAELTRVFENGQHYLDVPRVVWPDMGYTVDAWNGLDTAHGASLTVCPGAMQIAGSFRTTSK